MGVDEQNLRTCAPPWEEVDDEAEEPGDADDEEEEPGDADEGEREEPEDADGAQLDDGLG